MALVNPPRYDTPRDAEMRLGRSVIRYKGDPFYVIQVHGDNTCSGIKLRDNQNLNRIHTSDSDLDISSPPLGYMNIYESAFYISRMPRRRNKQGFCEQSAFIIAENKELTAPANTLIVTPQFADLIEGRYPSALEALNQLESKQIKVHSIGFSRKFAFVKDRLGIVKLHHMGRPVGFMKDSRISIPDEFRNEYFDKALGKAGLTAC